MADTNKLDDLQKEHEARLNALIAELGGKGVEYQARPAVQVLELF